MKNVFYTLVMILNCTLCATFGYLYGFNKGMQVPTVDRTAIEQAVFTAIMEQ